MWELSMTPSIKRMKGNLWFEETLGNETSSMLGIGFPEDMSRQRWSRGHIIPSMENRDKPKPWWGFPMYLYWWRGLYKKASPNNAHRGGLLGERAVMTPSLKLKQVGWHWAQLSLINVAKKEELEQAEQSSESGDGGPLKGQRPQRYTLKIQNLSLTLQIQIV